MQNSHQIDQEAAGDAGLSYTEAFPALPDKVTPARPAASPWPGRPQGPQARMTIATSAYSETLVISYEERRLKEAVHFGGNNETEKSVCQEIRRDTGAQITITEGKDQSLTLLISGKREEVKRARNLALQRLQTQAHISLPIPKEYHRYLLGQKGRTKEEIEASTATKIFVPKMDDQSDAIRITGPAEGIAVARDRIQQIYDEQSKRGVERLEIPKKYHPFVLGPYNKTVESLRASGVQINIPPSNVYRDEISFSGEKSAVAVVKKELLKILHDAQKMKEITVDIPRGQHRYVQGPRSHNLHDILEKTGVWVELPPADSDSNSVTLRGDPTAIGHALNMVWNKANSVVKVEIKAPSYIHKHMIGRGGEKVKDLSSQFPEVHVSYATEEDKIIVEGPPNDVDTIKKLLEAEVKTLVSTLAVQEMTVDEKYMKHIIGKNGANVSRLKNELGVQVRAGDAARPNVIVIEGPKQGVADAIKQLKERVSKMENERSKDIIIDRKLHKLIIGQKGDKIREIRELFKETNVLFPDADENSDVVTIRGPKDEVEKCFKHMEKLVKDLALSNYTIEVPIFKDMHRSIIGKGGATVRKIREETDTKIDLPEQESDSDVILITGKKENAEKAKKLIEKIQNELANAVEVKLTIANKLHTHIIGAKGQKIQAVIQECGNVQITIPPTGSNSDEIIIRGPKDDAEKARDLLQKLAHDKELSSYTVEIPAKQEYHKYIRNSANRLRERYNVRMTLPSATQEDKEIITVIGKKEDVEKAKADIEKTIKELQNTVDDTVSIPVKYHKRFTASRAKEIQEIEYRAGNVRVTFPRDESETISLRGPREAVDEAKKLLLQRVQDWESYVTIEFSDIPPKSYGQVMGRGGIHLAEIQREFDVQIKFPDRTPPSGNQTNGPRGGAGPGTDQAGSQVNGHDHDNNGQTEVRNAEPAADVRPVITITGRPADCQSAKEALLALVPIEDEMLVPTEFHRGLVGEKGVKIQELGDKYEVNISVPGFRTQSEVVRLWGLRENVEACKEEIRNELKELALKNFKTELRVDPKHHPLLIGPKGVKINHFRKSFNVDVQFPRRVAGNDEKPEEEAATEQPDRDLIILTGYEADVIRARENIQAFIDDLNSKVVLEVRLDSRIHARIIGGKGMGLRKLCDKYKVDIRFPRRDSSEDPDTVIITGDEDRVYEAETELKRLEDLYLEDVVENESLRQYHNPRPIQPQAAQNGSSAGPGFVIRGAPWERQDSKNQQLPQTGNLEEFPSLAGVPNGNGQATAVTSNSRWGAPR